MIFPESSKSDLSLKLRKSKTKKVKSKASTCEEQLTSPSGKQWLANANLVCLKKQKSKTKYQEEENFLHIKFIHKSTLHLKYAPYLSKMQDNNKQKISEFIHQSLDSSLKLP